MNIQKTTHYTLDGEGVEPCHNGNCATFLSKLEATGQKCVPRKQKERAVTVRNLKPGQKLLVYLTDIDTANNHAEWEETCVTEFVRLCPNWRIMVRSEEQYYTFPEDYFVAYDVL